MSKTEPKNAADYIHPLNMNGLNGRMLHMPAPAGKKREILFIYGHHSSIERWWGVIQDLNKYGAVTVPDLPGFGGMDSFYKIGQKPTIDALADYLAAFIKLRYKNKRITIAGLSLGFVIVTRMLQRYPDLVKKVDLLVSVVGFSHRDDFAFNRMYYWFYRLGGRFFSYRIPAFFFKNLLLNPWVIRAGYARTNNAKAKFQNISKAELKRYMDYEIYLWHCNDVRTYNYTGNQFLRVDNCTQQVDLPVWHIAVKDEQYFDHQMVEQHMRVIFNDFHQVYAEMDSHAPTIIDDPKQAAGLFPAQIRRILSRS